jgi:TRAP-type C4-dicarboxylate transport system substrate-binding protein
LKKTLLALAAVLLARPALSQEVTIKLGTLAPSGSTWHVALKEMGEKWAQVSGGKVKLRIYPGGTQGGEGDMVRKMEVGQLQAASITNVGMHDIAPEPQALAVPLMFEDEREFEAVFAKVRPKLDQLIEKRGYVPLQWSRVGFVKWFCSKPYQSPAEMSDAKVFAWEGDPDSVEAWKSAGFRPVVLSSTDVVPSLQTGMINCITQAPLYVLTARLFDKAPNMIDVNWGYIVGATLVKRDTWDKVPAELRPKLIELAREAGRKVDDEARRMEAESIEAMKKQGLKVVQVDRGPWRKSAERAWPVIRGKVIPADFFDEVVTLRDAARGSSARK